LRLSAAGRLLAVWERTAELSTFAFTVHPLTARDVARKYKLAAWLPDPVVEWSLRFVPPKQVSHITGVRSATGAEVDGYFIACPLTARQLAEGDPNRAIAKIIEGGRAAQALGAKILGLGAFTSIVGDAGITIARELDIAVTTGNSYTVATAMEAAVAAAEMLGHTPRECSVAILGATGSIGKVAAKMLAPQVAEVVLNARTGEKLAQLAEEIGDPGCVVRTETDVAAALRGCQIVIAVTSSLETVVEPEMLAVGAVVCDVARPRDVSKRVAEMRDDVLVIEGGAVAVPGDVEFNFNFGFPPKEAYACMAETMILALEGKFEDYSLGRDIRIEQVQEIAALGRKHGFKLAGFRSFERRVDAQTIQRIRERMADASVAT